MTWLDSIISWASPQTGLVRARARAASQALLAYEGASVGRRTSGWSTTGASANSEVGAALSRLRERSRDLGRNNPHGSRAINEITGQTIGTGIQAQAQEPSEELNAAIDNAWESFVEECDSDGQLDFYGIEELVLRTMLESGECLIRFRQRRVEDGFRVPLQLQVLEPDYLDLSKTEKTATGYIIQGVEFDLLNRRVAYWLFAEHPGDVLSTSLRGNVASYRIPASEIVHIYRKKRPGQVRGVPLLTPVILAMRDLDEYQDAERVRKKIEACLAAFIEQSEGIDGLTTGAITGTDPSGQKIEEFRPGMVLYGKPGEKATFFAPTGAGGYAEYVRDNKRDIAVGVDMTYEQLSGDLSTVNYSSYKAGHLSFQTMIESLRWLCLIPMFLRPVRRRFIEAAFTAGAIPALGYRTVWTPPAFGSIDPLKEAQAVELDLATGRKTWPQSVSEQGQDPRKQITEIKKWKPELDAAGITFRSVGGGNQNGNQTQQPTE